MKKLLISLSTLASVSLLVACQSQDGGKDQVKDETVRATLTVQFDENNSETKEVTAEKDDSVMDVLEDHFEVEEDNGIVTAINGVSQDVAKNTYWMYDINGEMAPKGAEEITLAEGDTVVFYLDTFE